jgi:hypothetical protein
VCDDVHRRWVSTGSAGRRPFDRRSSTMEPSGTPVDEYFAELNPAQARVMRALDRVLSEELAGLERVLWEGPMWGGTYQRIVGYGAIRQPRPRGEPVDWFLVGLAAQSRHFSIYVNAVEDGRYLIQSRADTLGRVKVGAAAVTFPALESLDLDGLRAMVRRARELTPAT